MLKRMISPVVALALIAPATSGQQPQQRPPQTQNRQDSGDEVLKVTTNLVQFDVVVTDKQGRQITDLAPEDFEVSEDGKRVQITNFSYVDAMTTTTPAVAASAPGAKGAARAEGRAPSVAPATLRREQVRRTVALVVDDLGLSFESMGFVRDALRKFVDEQMQPTDAVAIFRTSAGMGALQRFTSDKRALHAAIDGVRWFPAGRAGVSRFTPLNEDSAGSDRRDVTQFSQEMEEARAQHYSAGSFGAASAVVSGLADMPGRKSVVFISEAFRIFHAQGRNTHLIEAMVRLTTQANAASVTFYTMDASGLTGEEYTAEDQPGAPSYVIAAEQFASAGQNGVSPLSTFVRPNAPPRILDRIDTIVAQGERDASSAFRRLNAMMDQRRQERHEAHTVLSYLAAKTGGLFMRNRNDLGGAMRRIMDDQSGYYLIGYRPNLSEDERDARAARLRGISVKVKRPGAEVRTRAAYLGVSDADRRAKPRTREEQLTAALVSPFASGDVRVRLTSLFGTEPAASTPQPYVRALLHVDARDLSFKEEAGGARSTEVEVVGVVVGDKGEIVGQDSAIQTVRAPDQEEFKRLRRDGLVFIFNFPVKRAGSYQLRVAARESSSERLGAASHFVEVPNLGGSRLALSGVVLSGADAPPAQPGAQAGPAVRQLRQGQLLDYRYYIHNAKAGPDGRPQLQTQMKIFRDNQPVFTGKLAPYDAAKQADPKRLGAGGRVRIGPELTPGRYLLQVTVTDALVPGERGTATQWIDFEVVG